MFTIQKLHEDAEERKNVCVAVAKIFEQRHEDQDKIIHAWQEAIKFQTLAALYADLVRFQFLP